MKNYSPLVTLQRAGFKQCPICAKPDNCSARPDRSAVFCRRWREAGRFDGKEGADGGMLFVLNDSFIPPARPVASKPKVIERASADHLHRVYSELLALLPLQPRHLDDLLRRGLPLREIQRRGYRSTWDDSQARELAQRLEPLGLAGVPGFFKYHGEWTLARCLPGFFVPYRDRQERIGGMMFRLDVPIEKQKYRWLSTKDRIGGTSSGAPLHFARPHLIPKAREIWLTEGALKSDVAAYYLRAPFIASGGVTQWRANFAARFKSSFPHIRQIVIAFDSDWRVNDSVRAALERLMRLLDEAQLRFIVRTWPQSSKGIDDYCLSLHQQKGAIAA